MKLLSRLLGSFRARKAAAAVLIACTAGMTTAVAVTGRDKSGGVSAPDLAAPFCEKAGSYTLLSREEFENMQHLARRVSSMMGEILPFQTRVWPHAVRDSKGRAGLFLESALPMASLSGTPDQEYFKGWLVCAVLAVGKYSVMPGVELDHVCFTDASGAEARWFYDVDIALVRNLHRGLVHKELSADEVYDQLISQWKRLEAEP